MHFDTYHCFPQIYLTAKRQCPQNQEIEKKNLEYTIWVIYLFIRERWTC